MTDLPQTHIERPTSYERDLKLRHSLGQHKNAHPDCERCKAEAAKSHLDSPMDEQAELAMRRLLGSMPYSGGSGSNPALSRLLGHQSFGRGREPFTLREFIAALEFDQGEIKRGFEDARQREAEHMALKRDLEAVRRVFGAS
jgi:hypothetical protein